MSAALPRQAPSHIPSEVRAQIPQTPEAALQAARQVVEKWRRLPAVEGVQAGPDLRAEAFAGSGLGAITVPGAKGGPGLSLSTLVQVFEILGGADTLPPDSLQDHFVAVHALTGAAHDAENQQLWADILTGSLIALPSDAATIGPDAALAQLIHAAIDSGTALAAFDAALTFLHEKSRPWIDSGVSRAQDDPFIIQEVGRLQIGIWAARQSLESAAAGLDLDHKAGLSAADKTLAIARILTARTAPEAAEKLFELAGTASARSTHDLARFWRNARIHGLKHPAKQVQLQLGAAHLHPAPPLP